MQSLFGLFTSFWFIRSISFHMCMRELLLSRSGLKRRYRNGLNELMKLCQIYQMQNTAKFRWDASAVFLFEDVGLICVLMKVVYLIVCH